ncbi:MAG: extracellular solute-binding protein [Opitutales bacterium]|nr:extracellular solute-binding protein [Opitutales bacterium]
MNGRLRHLGLVLAALGYAWALGWVFTRSAPVVASRPVTIRFAHWQIEQGPPDGMKAVIRRYEELNPRVKVEQVLVPGRIYNQWLRTNLVGGTGVDLVEYGVWLDGMTDIPARYFEPITDQMLRPNPYNRGTPLEHVPWVQTFTDGLQYQRVNAPSPGQFYCATMTEVSERLFCNQELLRAILGSDRTPQTFAELRALFPQVTAYAARTGRPIFALAGSRDNASWLLQFLLQGCMMQVSQRNDRYGSLALYNWDALGHYLEGRWSYRLPEARAGLTMMREVSVNMKQGFVQSLRDAATQEFLRGDAVFIFAGTWDGTSLRSQATFPVEVLRFPQPTPSDPVMGPYLYGRFADGGGGTAMEFYLNKLSAHPQEAVDFMHFMTSVEGSQLFTNHSGWLPATRTVQVPPAIRPYYTPLDCYSFGAEYMMIGASVNMAIMRNFHLLVGPQGSVDRFVDAMEAVMPAAARTDLYKEMTNRSLIVRPQDVRLMALAALGRRAPQNAALVLARERLECAQTQSEALMLKMARQLADAGPVK